ncbi:MAG: 3-deoxy-8-phosphooctulonate synthase [bacterium]|nr:3-deoxy-8-phosphooctulonate synthase [bacterium]MCP5071077.1 3-deoxy-8-phosphooctulonate synthase [bacterium]
MRIGEVPLGGGAPLVLIAGLNVVETESTALVAATRLAELAERHDFPMVFKASVDKANRSSLRSFRGPGFDEGLRILARVKSETGLPVTTDVHEPGQAKPASEVVDCLQIPAFLCRQTDLVLACAATGKPVNIKKGQFLAPEDLRLAVEKADAGGTGGAFVTERGVAFGYHDLVVDMEGLAVIREYAPVCYDATHSVQRPGAGPEASGGNRNMVLPLARAAVAVGIDALFVEVHPDPDDAPCDGPSQIDFETFERLLNEARAIDDALAATRS